MHLIPIILSGGSGTRLWPVSRELHPKPFLRMADNESLLQKTITRATRLPGVSDVVTVTNRDLYFKTCDEYQELPLGAFKKHFILEPISRNTAPAIALAALEAKERWGGDAILLVLAADHLIQDEASFGRAVEQACTLAADHRIVTFGIRPDKPETGFGYIEYEGNDVLRFIEKPNLETANGFLASGRFLWNSGMFCSAADTLLQELAEHAPDVLAAARASLAAADVKNGSDGFQLTLPQDVFASAPDLSIDYAVMEKSRHVAIVPCDIGWNDIGSWTALASLGPTDDKQNQVTGEHCLVDVEGCYIQGGDRIIGGVGLRDLVIVDTPDALLVADRSRAQDVKKIATHLKAIGHDAYKLHRTVHRPWGSYTVLEEAPGFKIKRIEVKPGAALSLQMHYHRSEHWIIVSGMAKVVNGEQEFFVNRNESTYIPAGCKHRLENPGTIDLVIIEVQNGEYLGEDDIVRFDDVYGRS